MIGRLGKPFSFYIKRSTAIHAGLIILAFLISKNFWLDGFGPKDSNIKMVKSSVRVDVVAMPKMTIKELKTLSQQQSKPAKVQESSSAKKAAPDTSKETSKIEFQKESKKKKKNFMDMLKKLSDKKVSKTKKKAKSNDDSGDGNEGDMGSRLNQLVIEGNQISKGSSLLGGDSGSDESEELGVYLNNLRDQVKLNWKLPSYLLEKDLRCRVRVFISQDGKLLKAEIYESSGNQDYDKRALEAVGKSSPFPPVTREIASKMGRGEVLLGFPL